MKKIHLCHRLPLLAAALLLASNVAGCGDDAAPGTAGGVTVQVIDAKAINGGCGDAPPTLTPDGGAVPCGPNTEFSVTVSLLNTSSKPVTVSPGGAALISVEGDRELCRGSLVARDSFDGTLAPGASITVTYDVERRSVSGSSSSEDVYYQVQLSIGGEPLTVKSPPTVFRPPPA